jgi:hypothetical protein
LSTSTAWWPTLPVAAATAILMPQPACHLDEFGSHYSDEYATAEFDQ